MGSRSSHNETPRVTVRSLAHKSTGTFWLIVVIAAIPAFLEGFDSNLYVFGSPIIVHQIHGAVSLLATAASGYAAGIAIFSIVGGYLFDRFSVKYVVIGSVAFFTAFTLLTGFVRTPVELLVVRTLVGVGIGVFQPAILALLGDMVFETRGRAVSAFAVFFGGGLLAGPYLIAPFLPHYQIPFIISGLASLAGLIVFYLVIPKTYKTLDRTKIALAGVFTRNVIFLSLSILFFGIALFGVSSYFSDYLLKFLLLPKIEAATIVGMTGLGGLVCAFPIGYLADRLGRKTGVTVSAALVMIGGVGLFIVSRNVAALIVLTLAFGAGRGIYASLVAALGQDSVDDAIAGSVTGWLFLVFNLGAFLGGPIFASLLSHGFATAGFLTVGLSSVLALLLTLLTRPIRQSNIVDQEVAAPPIPG
jgi:ACS family hexuronate transporter-like MFS transporter